jgi:hypothetical protein
MNQAQIDEYESIRNKRMEGIELADLKCRKLCMGNIPFSPKYKNLTDTIELWKAVIKKKRHCAYSQGKLCRLEKTTGIQNSLHCTLEQAVENEKLAYAQYLSFNKSTSQEWQTFLEMKAKSIAKESGSHKSSIITQLLLHKQQREVARRIKFTLHKIKKSGISSFELENPNGEIVEITTKAGIERACMNESCNKFQQTRNTPCMQEPLRSALGRFSNSDACRDILRGEYNPPANTPVYTREFLVQLKKPQAFTHPPPTAQISASMFQDGWRQMNEYTSAGISGLHFGHLKVCSLNTFTSNFESSVSHIPYNTGYSPTGWLKGVDVMIQKKEKVNLVTKLCTITLTEADFNFNNKILGKETPKHAEMNNLIAKEQYGSRKGKSAIEHVLHKRLTFDIMRQTRYNGALCSNEAKSCYDRILHSIASLACQRLGMPFPPVQCMINSI